MDVAIITIGAPAHFFSSFHPLLPPSCSPPLCLGLFLFMNFPISLPSPLPPAETSDDEHDASCVDMARMSKNVSVTALKEEEEEETPFSDLSGSRMRLEGVIKTNQLAY